MPISSFVMPIYSFVMPIYYFVMPMEMGIQDKTPLLNPGKAVKPSHRFLLGREEHGGGLGMEEVHRIQTPQPEVQNIEEKSKINLGNVMAPRAGFEPATKWLTATCSTTELPRNISIRIPPMLIKI